MSENERGISLHMHYYEEDIIADKVVYVEIKEGRDDKRSLVLETAKVLSLIAGVAWK